MSLTDWVEKIENKVMISKRERGKHDVVALQALVPQPVQNAAGGGASAPQFMQKRPRGVAGACFSPSDVSPATIIGIWGMVVFYTRRAFP
jgi:hypothetical protein